MKVYIVVAYEEYRIRDTLTYKIISIFKSEKLANNYREELRIAHKNSCFFVEEHEVIE